MKERFIPSNKCFVVVGDDPTVEVMDACKEVYAGDVQWNGAGAMGPNTVNTVIDGIRSLGRALEGEVFTERVMSTVLQSLT